jgi:hypothetical protein
MSAGLVASTLTPGSTAPDESLTVPAITAWAPAADGIDSPMYRDPELASPKVVRTFPPGLAERWLAALDRPEADLQAQAASATGEGLAGFLDTGFDLG